MAPREPPDETAVVQILLPHGRRLRVRGGVHVNAAIFQQSIMTLTPSQFFTTFS
jgi:hypothetical protein